MLDLERVASASAPALEGHHAVRYGVDGRALRRREVDTRVGAVDLVHGVEPGVGELRADARVFERRLEHLLAQARAVGLPVLDLASLPEGDGVGFLLALRELRAPDATDAGRDAVVDEPLVVDHREGVALLHVEEADAPLVDVLQFGGQRIGHLLLHDRAPERRGDRRAFLHAAQRAGFLVPAHRHRVAVEAEDHVFGQRALVDEVVEVGRMERVFVDEGGVLVSGANVAERKKLARRPVEAVDVGRAYAVRA